MFTPVILEDTFKQKGLRRQLIQELKKTDKISNAALLALEAVPRHWFFFDNALVHRAYEDTAFPIGEGQTISQPTTVGYQTDLLQLVKTDKVLEIGTGSGYQAAILAVMGAKVYTIERQKKLYDKVVELYKQAAKAIPALNYVKMYYGDGFEGLPAFAPYDKILVTCGAPEIPMKLVAQLKTGGKMVIPVNEGDAQRMWRITKEKDGSLHKEELDMFRFVPMLKGTNSQ